MVDDFKKYFVGINFEKIPRLDNKAIDAMVTIASLLQRLEQQTHYEFLVEQLFSPTYDNLNTQVIFHLVAYESPTYGKSYTYLKDNTLPPDLSRNQKWNLIRQVAQYTQTVNTLYWWGLDGTLLSCLESNKFEMALQEVHEGICGTHSSGPTLAKELLITGYYWSNMEKESYQSDKRF